MDDSRWRADASAGDATANDEDDAPVVQLAALAVLGVGLAALFLGYSWFWVVFALGFAVFVPMVKLATDALRPDSDAETDADTNHRGARETRDAPESKQDALDTLRDRYARGDLSDEEFERKVERLLETETPESAREHVSRAAERRRDAESEPGGGTDSESGREADREPE